MKFVEAFTYSIASRRVIPIVRPPEPIEQISTFNKEALQQVVNTAPDLLPTVTLASPVMGNGHTISWIDAVMLWSIINHGTRCPQTGVKNHATA
jgi:hypothetical protein